MKIMREYAKLSGNENERWFVKLSESGQHKYTEQTATVLLDKLKSITESKDFASDDTIKKIRNSRGNVNQIKEFNEASLCVTKLSSLTGKTLSPKITELQELIEFLQTRSQYFTHGFDTDSYMVTNLYLSLVLTVFHATATFILRGIDYVKTPRGEFEIRMKNFEMEDDVVLSSLSASVANIRNGKMDNFLKTSVKKESMILTEEILSTMFIGMFGMFVIWSILNMRNIIYLFLRFRKRTADWFNAYADYIEMHAQSISKDRKDVAQRQMKIAERFRKAADIFAVESQIANRSTLVDTKKQDIEVSGDVKVAQSSDSGSIII